MKAAAASGGRAARSAAMYRLTIPLYTNAATASSAQSVPGGLEGFARVFAIATLSLRSPRRVKLNAQATADVKVMFGDQTRDETAINAERRYLQAFDTSLRDQEAILSRKCMHPPIRRLFPKPPSAPSVWQHACGCIIAKFTLPGQPR